MGVLENERLRGLIDAHGSAVGNYLRRRIYPLSHADLDDLVEQTFVVWRRIDDVPRGEGERPWIIGVARNVLHNGKRATRRRTRHEAWIVALDDAASAEDEAMADIAGLAALDALAAGDREILILHYWDGLELADLALMLGITSNAVGTRLSRAKARFSDGVRSLEPVGVPTAASDMKPVEEEKRSL